MVVKAQDEIHLQVTKGLRPYSALSLLTRTFQNLTIVENTGIVTMRKENTTSAQMSRLEEDQRFMILSTMVAPTVVRVLYDYPVCKECDNH